MDATEDKLFCDQTKWLRSSDRLVFDRKDVRQVRAELGEVSNQLLNTAIGAAAGYCLGAIANAEHSQPSMDARFVLTPIGALMGGQGLAHVRILHIGRTIYRR